MNHREEQHPAKEWLNRHSNVVVYTLLVLVVVLAFFLDSQNQKEDLKKRCIAGVDTRNANRAIVEAVYGLAVGSIQRDPDAPPLTKEEVKQYNTYIARVNRFREQTYKLIKPSASCARFVKDDNIIPPTPPTPPLK